MQQTINNFIDELRNVQETSKESYKLIWQIGLNSLYGKIVRLLLVYENLTINEIADKLNIQRSTISPRIKELREKGVIIKSSERESKITKIRNISWKLSEDYQNKIKLVN